MGFNVAWEIRIYVFIFLVCTAKWTKLEMFGNFLAEKVWVFVVCWKWRF